MRAAADRDGANPLRPLAPEDFREVIGHFASGVTVVTAIHEGEWFGTTASAVASLSLQPPMLLVCMNEASATGRAIAASRRFAVNILTVEQPEVAERFARQGSDFEGVAVEPGHWGEPLLAESLAILECRVAEQVSGGTHIVFIAEVDHGAARGGAPLAYFRGMYGRLELPAADDGESPTLDAVEEAITARLAIELGVVDLTVGSVGKERIEELREAAGSAGFGERLAALGGPALARAHARLEVGDWLGAEATARHNRLLVDAYEAGDVEAARRCRRDHAREELEAARGQLHHP